MLRSSLPERLHTADGLLNTVKYVLLALACLGILYARAPGVFTHPQFWAEDGAHFYQPSDENLLGSFALPYAGSLQTTARIGAAISQAFPLDWAPAIFLGFAVFIQILPVLLIYTRRFKRLVPNAWARLLLSVFYLAQPNTWEIHANLTNTNWHIAISAFLLLIAPTVASRFWKSVDRIVIVLASLTGPFGFFLAPIAIYKYLSERSRLNLEKMLLILACCLIQIIPLAQMENAGSLDVGYVTSRPEGIVRIVGTQVGGAGILGANTFLSLPLSPVIVSLLAALVLSTSIVAFAYGNRPLRMMIAFGAITLTASMFRSQTGDLHSLWEELIRGQGDRYFFIPTLVWFTLLVYLVGVRNRLVASLSLALVASVLLIAIPADFTLPKKTSTGFYGYADRLQHSPKGTTLCHEVNPKTPDKAWELCLTKR